VGADAYGIQDVTFRVRHVSINTTLFGVNSYNFRHRLNAIIIPDGGVLYMCVYCHKEMGLSGMVHIHSVFNTLCVKLKESVLGLCS
jgi:hypothetical protein